MVVAGVGLAAVFYLAAVSYSRFVRRPQIVLGRSKVELPIGELGAKLVVIRRGNLVSVSEGKTPGGWRYVRAEHRGGVVTISSALLPDEAAFNRLRDQLASFVDAAELGRRT